MESMKYVYYSFLTALVTILSISKNYAQTCTPNTSVTAIGIYPDTLPTGTVGIAYSETITFVMPLDTLGYDFTNFEIISVSLPIGLNWACNNAGNGCNYDPQVNAYGCVSVYGTPLLAGTYNVAVTALADLTVTSNVPVTFNVYFVVLPANVNTSNDGFSMSGFSGCNPVTVSFTNNHPGLLAYAWDFGNGNLSTSENPSPQVYTTLGNTPVRYKAWSNLDTVNVYTLTNFRINSMSNYGEGFPAFESPDAYYKLYKNGVLINTSSILTNTAVPCSWTASDLLNSSDVFSVEVWESDAQDFGFGSDDLMGSHTLQLTGCAGCGAGSSNINYTITNQVILPVPAYVSADTVRVYPYPNAPNIYFDSLTHTVFTDSTNNTLLWFFNGSPVSSANVGSLVITNTGYYSVVALNTSGCTKSSDSVFAIYCGPTPPPLVAVDGPTYTVANVNNDAVQWYLNGAAIPGATANFLFIGEGGTYVAKITNQYGCVSTTSPQISNLSLGENAANKFYIYPNPNKGIFTLQLKNVSEEISSLELFDVLGRKIWDGKWNQLATQEINIQNLTAGAYNFRIVTNNGAIQKRIVIQ
jgi:Secretion system C-terminal sorting domain